MSSTIATRIESLRKAMKHEAIHACIIPSSDPHISEYPAEHWKCREWISGFTGSAGTVVITTTKAGLWTDSRYFLQAKEQLQDTEIELFRDGLPGTPDMKEWLLKELPLEGTIGIDGDVFSMAEASGLIRFFSNNQINIDTSFSPFDKIWKNRPAVPTNKIFILPEEFSGARAKEKVGQTVSALHEAGANMTIIGSLDAIAWLFNIRGNDIKFNPVAITYAVVSDKETVLFIDPEKLTKEAADYLQGEGIILADYNKIYDYIENVEEGTNILINEGKINYTLFDRIPANHAVISTAIHPVDLLKSIKNNVEIEGFRNAMKRDGVALVRFFIWLEKSLNDGTPVTEMDISRKLREYRSEQDYYYGESFDTIAGYGAHGAIVHYSADEKSNATIEKKGLLLIDSGAQFFDGTTDITRTIAVGETSIQMRCDYTAVLKGHIALARAQFPKGTKGIQLDILARKELWESGLNYLHGTGHGIGHFLNVHEGPQSIRMEFNPCPILVGMVTSNEPGVYKTNEYGIRIENLLLTTEKQKTVYGEFYQFETITLCPIDTVPVEKSLLSQQEIDWLNSYHQHVFETLSPLLSEEEKIWLKNKTNEF